MIPCYIRGDLLPFGKRNTEKELIEILNDTETETLAQ